MGAPDPPGGALAGVRGRARPAGRIVGRELDLLDAADNITAGTAIREVMQIIDAQGARAAGVRAGAPASSTRVNAWIRAASQ